MALKELEIPVNVTGNADVKLSEIDNQMKMLQNTTYVTSTSAAGFNMAWDKAGQGMDNINDKMKTMTQTNLRATYTMFQMNQVVRDLPFGFIAISNNLPLLYDQFMLLNRASGGLKATFSALASAVFSPSGLAIAASGLISILTVLSIKSQKASEEVGKFSLETIAASTEAEKFAESIENVRKELEKLTDAQVVSRMERMQQTFNEAVGDYGLATSIEFTSTWGVIVNWMLGNNPDESLTKMREALAGLNQADEVLSGDRSRIGNLQKQIKDLEDVRYSFPVGTSISNFDAVNSVIKGLQEELDRLLGKQKNVREEAEKMVDRMSKSMQWEGSGAGNAYRNLSVGIEATMKRIGEFAITADFSRQYSDTIRQMNRVAEIGADVLRDSYNEAWENVFGTANSLFEKFANRIVEFAMSDLFTELGISFAKWGLTLLGFPEMAGLVTASETVGGKSGSGDRSMYLVVGEEVVGKFVDKRLPDSINRNQKLGIIY